MYTETNRAERATVYLGMMTMLQCPAEPPTTSKGASRAGLAYAVAYLSDDLYTVTGLARALDEYVGEAMGADGMHEFAAVNVHGLAEIVGKRIAVAAAQMAGFFARDVGKRSVWSDAPMDYAGPFLRLDFDGMDFDGLSIVATGEVSDVPSA